jgi:hypothetical protein
MSKMPTELQAVIDRARDWLTERTPSDPTEKRLAAAIYRAFPNEADVKENCSCDDPAGCDECLSRSDTDALIQRWEAASA